MKILLSLSSWKVKCRNMIIYLYKYFLMCHKKSVYWTPPQKYAKRLLGLYWRKRKYKTIYEYAFPSSLQWRETKSTDNWDSSDALKFFVRNTYTKYLNSLYCSNLSTQSQSHAERFILLLTKIKENVLEQMYSVTMWTHNSNNTQIQNNRITITCSRLSPKTHAENKKENLPDCLFKMYPQTQRSLLAQKILTVSCPSDCQGIKAMKRCESSWANRIKDG